MKKSKSIFFIISLSLLIFVFLGYSFIYGEEKEKPVSIEYPFPGLPKEVTFEQYVKGLFNFFIGLAGLILFSVFIYGGFLYLLSAGDPNKKEEGKRKIKQAIIGVSLLLLLYLVNWTLFHKASVFIPSPPKWPLSSLTPGVWICKESVSKLSEYFDKNKAGEAIQEIEKKCDRYPPDIKPVKDIGAPKFFLNIPSNPWTNPSYDTMVIIGSDYKVAESTTLGEKTPVGYKIGEIKSIIKFEKGEISFPADGKIIIILQKTTPPSGNGVTLYACESGWNEALESCPERINKLSEEKGVTIVYPIEVNSDFTEITPPKEGEVDFSSDTRAIEVDDGISAIFCNSHNKCTLVKGGQKVNIYELGSVEGGGVAVISQGPSASTLKSDIKKIYIIKGVW